MDNDLIAGIVVAVIIIIVFFLSKKIAAAFMSPFDPIIEDIDSSGCAAEALMKHQELLPLLTGPERIMLFDAFKYKWKVIKFTASFPRSELEAERYGIKALIKQQGEIIAIVQKPEKDGNLIAHDIIIAIRPENKINFGNISIEEMHP